MTRRADAILAAALGGVALAWFSLTWSHTLDPRDEGYLLSRALQVAAGEVPHRDFVDVYGPLVFGVTGPVLAAADGQILPVRWLIGVAKALAVVATFLLARRFAPTSVSVIAALAATAYWGRADASLNTPYAALFTLPLCLWSTLGVLQGLARRSPRWLFVAGAAAGLSVLAKQSVGLLNVYAGILGIWGATWLLPPPGATTSRAPRAVAALFAVAGLVVLVPVARFLDPAAWAIHFAPLQLAMAAVVIAVLRRGQPSGSLAAAARVAIPFVLGAAAPLLATAGLYAVWGALGALLWDMFAIPQQYRSYALPIPVPTPWVALAVAGFVGLLHSALLATANRRRPAAAIAVASTLAIAAALAAAPALREPATLVRLPFALEGLLSPAIAFAAIALVLVPALRAGDRARAARVLPLLFAHTLLCVQVFPRAGHNLWALHGALVPLLAVVLGAWLRTGATRGARQALALVAVAWVPVWLVAPLVSTVLHQHAEDATRRELALPRTRGITLPRGEIAARHLDDLETLVAHLATLEPASAPLFLLGNEEMIRLLAGRPHLFPERTFSLFLAGWGILPRGLGDLDDDAMLERLGESRNAILVQRRDATSSNLKSAMPRVAAAIERDFVVTRTIGGYRVMRTGFHAMSSAAPEPD